MAIERIIPATPIEGELEASVQVEIEGSNGMAPRPKMAEC